MKTGRPKAAKTMPGKISPKMAGPAMGGFPGMGGGAPGGFSKGGKVGIGKSAPKKVAGSVKPKQESAKKVAKANKRGK